MAKSNNRLITIWKQYFYITFDSKWGVVVHYFTLLYAVSIQK